MRDAERWPQACPAGKNKLRSKCFVLHFQKQPLINAPVWGQRLSRPISRDGERWLPTKVLLQVQGVCPQMEMPQISGSNPVLSETGFPYQ